MAPPRPPVCHCLRSPSIPAALLCLQHQRYGCNYDDLFECRGDYPRALARFQKNLAYLRQFGPVTTMTMEGAPRSRYDNRNLWLGRVDERREESMRAEKMHDTRLSAPDAPLP